MPIPRTTHAFLASLLPALLGAQNPSAPFGARFDPRVPIQVGQCGRSFAAGSNYKVEFRDGVIFHPFVGREVATTPTVAWRTASVRVGVTELLAPDVPARPTAQPWRYQLDRGALTEVYDVRADGVEQSFVVHAPPPTAGDLVVRGAIDTVLAGERRAPRPGELCFRDPEGTTLVSYGAAIAFDAGGRRTDVATGFDGNTITLRVPGEWLADAAFPVTVDPLLGARGYNWTDVIDETDIGHDGISQTRGMMVAFTTIVSASDTDLRVYLANDDFSSAVVVHAVLGGMSTCRSPAVAFLAAANRWLTVWEQSSSGGSPMVTSYSHVRQNPTPESGTTFSFPSGSRRPDVGGSRGFDQPRALVVWEREVAGTGVIEAATFDPIAQAIGPVLAVDGTSASWDRRNPTVNQATLQASEPWIVAWDYKYLPLGHSRVVGSKVTMQGSSLTASNANSMDYTGSGTAEHRMRPSIAGADGHYLVAYVAGPTWGARSGTQIHTVRVEWPAQSVAVRLRLEIHDEVSQPFSSLADPSVAFDETSLSHWAVTYQRVTGLVGAGVRLDRVGFFGGTVESRLLSALNGSTMLGAPSVTFDRRNRVFPAAFGTRNPDGQLAVDRLGYSPDAGYAILLPGCWGGVSADRPDAGSRFFRIHLHATDVSAAALLASATQVTTPLAGIGMPGCVLYLGPIALSVPAVVNGGTASVNVPLPDSPLFLGDAHFQWAMPKPGANALGVVASPGLTVRVR